MCCHALNILVLMIIILTCYLMFFFLFLFKCTKLLLHYKYLKKKQVSVEIALK